MALRVEKRGKLTYYREGDRPVLSALVTEAQAAGDLKIYFAKLAGGYSARSALGWDELVLMDLRRQSPLVSLLGAGLAGGRHRPIGRARYISSRCTPSAGKRLHPPGRSGR